MFRLIKRFMPRSLFGRALVIIVSPVILLQIVSTYIFYDQHWQTLSQRLSLGVAGDITFVIHLLEDTGAEAQRSALLDLAMRDTVIRMDYRAGEILPNMAHPDRQS